MFVHKSAAANDIGNGVLVEERQRSLYDIEDGTNVCGGCGSYAHLRLLHVSFCGGCARG